MSPFISAISEFRTTTTGEKPSVSEVNTLSSVVADLVGEDEIVGEGASRTGDKNAVDSAKG